ncbi:MAG TPA: YbhB/YbcL family Raf kinase inhibitor-like protein [Steroidobacteraceae bacterium]
MRAATVRSAWMAAASTAAALALSGLPSVASAAPFRIELPTVAANGTLAAAQVFDGLGCHGGNISPAVKWRGAPSGTRSFAVTLYDRDARKGSGWWHWVVYDIPVTVNELPAHAGDAGGRLLPPGAVQGRSDFGTAAFGGPCPPPGDKPHRYVFTVYALRSATLTVPAGSGAAQVGALLKAGQLASSSVTAYYGR